MAICVAASARPAGHMQNDVDRHILFCPANSPQNLFAVVDIDVAGQMDAKRIFYVENHSSREIPAYLKILARSSMLTS